MRIIQKYKNNEKKFGVPYRRHYIASIKRMEIWSNLVLK